MTTSAFELQHPKPWKLVGTSVGFSLKDANGNSIGYLNLCAWHKGIPQKEWNRHLAAGLKEYFEVEAEP